MWRRSEALSVALAVGHRQPAVRIRLRCLGFGALPWFGHSERSQEWASHVEVSAWYLL